MNVQHEEGFCLAGHAQSRSMNDIADTPSPDQVNYSWDKLLNLCHDTTISQP